MIQNKKIFLVLIHILVWGALVVFLVGDELGIALVRLGAGVMFGVGLIVAGIHARLTGQLGLWKQKQDSAEPLDSVPASVWGLALIGVGVTVLLFVVALVLGLDQRVEGALARFVDTPLGLPIIWLLFGGGAIVWVLWSIRNYGFLVGMARMFPIGCFGLALFVIGLITFMRQVAPSWFDALATVFWDWFSSL
jgi:hypothetical protein